jgi:hypothetical protein
VLPQPLVQKSFYNLQNSFFPQNFLATQTVEKIKKIQAIWDKCVVDPTRNRVSLHCLKCWANFQEFPTWKYLLHMHISFVLIQGRRVLDNCGEVGWQKVLNDKFWNL